MCRFTPETREKQRKEREIREKQRKEREIRAAIRAAMRAARESRRLGEPLIVSKLSGPVLDNICKYLDNKDIGRLTQVSKQINEDIKTNGLQVLKNFTLSEKHAKLNLPVAKKVKVYGMKETILANFLEKHKEEIDDIRLVDVYHEMPTRCTFPKILRLSSDLSMANLSAESYANVKKLYFEIYGDNAVKLLQVMPQLTKLSFINISTSKFEINAITKMSLLESIELRCVHELDLCEIIKKCTRLKRLTVRTHCMPAFERLNREMCVFPNITKLKLISMAEHPYELHRCFPNLEILDVRLNTDRAEKWQECLRGLPKLRRLVLGESTCVDQLIGSIPPSVTELYIQGAFSEMTGIDSEVLCKSICDFLDTHPALWGFGMIGNKFGIGTLLKIIEHLPPGLRDFGVPTNEFTNSIAIDVCTILQRRCKRLRYLFVYTEELTDTTRTQMRSMLDWTTVVFNGKNSRYIKHP